MRYPEGHRNVLFAERGIRYITLAHGLSNQISDSSYDDEKNWGGLSPFGKEVIKEMNRVVQYYQAHPLFYDDDGRPVSLGLPVETEC